MRATLTHITTLLSTSFAIFAFASVSFAQIDPSTMLLLNKGSQGNPRDSGLDSGRYTVRPKSEAPKREEKNPTVKRNQDTESGPSETPQGDASLPVVSQPSVQVPNTQAEKSSAAIEKEEARPPARDDEPAKNVEVSDDSASHADRRLNILELSFAPTYIYADSDSSYAFRNYFTSSPAISADAKVWLNPAFALHLGYMGTLSGSVNDSLTEDRSVPASHQWFTAGVRSRKISASSSSSLTLGADYFEYKFHLSSDAQLRGRNRSTGVLLSAEANLSVNSHRSWILAFSIAPKLRHKESSTEVEFESGGSVDSNAIGFGIGQRFQFDRFNAIYWKLSHTYHKEIFSGEASVEDPVTGTIPSGVSVQTSFTIFQIGYTWGN